MTIEQIGDARNAQPFKRFTSHLEDGRLIPFESPEYLSSSPSGRTFVVWQPNDHVHIVDFLLVTDLEIELTSNGAGKRRKN
jgi:hypothetical protein